MEFRRPAKKQRGAKRKQQQGRPTRKISYDPNLPHEVIVEILSFLPVKSLLQFKKVCKTWRELIENRSFIKKHLQRGSANNDNFSLMVQGRDRTFSVVDFNGVSTGKSESFDYPFKNEYNCVQILASCDGMFCLTITEEYCDTITCLWNLSTGEYKWLKLPEKNIDHDNDERIALDEDDNNEQVVYGLGYDCSIEDYKLVRLEPYAGNEGYDSRFYDAKVYTLGLDSWTRIGDIPYALDDDPPPPGVLVNGAFHWTAYSHKKKSKLRVKSILALDLGTGKHREVPLPAGKHDNNVGMKVGELEGCLCILCNVDYTSVTIWRMKEYGVRKSWSKVLTIAQPTVFQSFYNLKLVKMVKHGAILLNDGNESCFLLYGKNYGSVRKLKVVGSVQAYVGSLVSLGSGTYVEQFDVDEESYGCY